MPEGLDSAVTAFANEVAPQSRPRDQGGKFVATKSAPEPMFGAREIEGDPLTGDTRDGGDNERLRSHEREVADGRAERPPARREPEDDDVEEVEQEPERISAEVGADDDSGERQVERQGDDEKYEVTVDGQTHEVTLDEALAGYIRQQTFHQRMAKLNELQGALEAENGKINANWQMWHKARAAYEEDLGNMIPHEPNWDEAFARNPAQAHADQKVYRVLYAKLSASQQARAERERLDQEEADRRLQKYAVDGFAKFVAMHPRALPDEAALKKNLQSMRRTAMAVGFSEAEVATVYDPRMLTVLLKASKYDRMMAAGPRAVIPGKGKTLTPGAATPLGGNGRRNGFDDAQRQLARSGKLSDAVDVFRRML
jgi:hypothetical protein